MRRVDRRTNALPTDRPTDRPTDTASYRGALSHLKMALLHNNAKRGCLLVCLCMLNKEAVFCMVDNGLRWLSRILQDDKVFSHVHSTL